MLTPQITPQGLTKQQLIELGTVMGTGLIVGGIISINANNTKFDISAGTGFITDNFTDPLNPIVTMVSWDAMTGISATYLTTNNETQLMIDSGGNVIQHNYALTYEESRDYIYLGRIIHAGRTVITNVSNVPKSILSTAENIYDIARAIGPINISGNDVTPDGANLNFNMSAGSIYRFGSNWSNSRKTPNISTISESTPVSFQYRYRDGSGGYTIGTSRTAIDPLKMDDGTGTLANVPNNKWTIQRVYLFSIGTKYVTYGQVVYNTLEEAQIGVLEERPTVDPQFADACLRAFIIVKQSSTNLNDITNDIVPAGKFGESMGSGGGSQNLQQVTDIGANTTIESTFSGGLITNNIKGINTAGLKIENHLGDDVALFGAGSSQGTTFYGGVVMNTIASIATSLTTPRVIGGTGVTSILELVGTSGNGTLTSPAVQVKVGNNGATTALTVLNNGKVGIGTTTPSQKLTVSGGDIGIDGGGYRLRFANGTDYLFARSEGAGTGIQTSFANYLRIGTGSQNLRFYDDSSSTVPAVSFVNGNVGIGTTSPSARLHILSATEQFRSGFDASIYWNATTAGVTGITTFNAVGGTTPSFVFADEVITVASTTATAGFNIPAGVAPTTPVNGDIWQDGTDIKIRIGGVTKTFTLI